MKMVTRRKWQRVCAFAMTLCMVFTATISLDAISVKAETTAGITCSEAGGWMESAYAEWAPVTGATSYEAYIKAAGAAETAYVQLDDDLIRNYDSYYRVDALGLAAGDYTLKVVANTEKESFSFTKNVSASKYDRTGFAWVSGTASGAYNEDGTLKSNAVVLYVTEDTKDTVNLDVVTNAKGATTSTVGLQNILNAYKKGYDNRPLDIRIIGQITDPSVLDGGDLVISGSGENKRLSCGITVEGVGEDATVFGWGIRVKNASNVEIRNIGIMAVDSKEGDNIGLQQGNDHIWVHNCDFFYGLAGSDKDQAKGDGALDCKLSTYVTFSYNHFYDNGKCNLLGLSEDTTEGLYITYHHNWYDHSDSRHPRVRFYSAHVYNNYYDGNAKYGVGACLGSSVFVEGNYFRNVPYPILTSMQGSDVVADWDTLTRDVANLATFSKENGGTIKAYNNAIVYSDGYGQAHSYVTYQENQTEFDAYEVTSERDTVPSTVTSYAGGNTYNNFDTSSVMYDYTLQSPEEAKATVTAYAGRMNGGDFSWTFTEADDTDYSVNQGLKSAVVGYKTSLVSVGGGSTTAKQEETATETTTAATTEATTETTTSTTQASTETAGSQTVSGAVTHNFTEDGLKSSYFTISGNLSDSKGTVTYNNLTLTQCLKIETATSITFTTTSESTLTLVFNSGNSKNIKVDGNKKNLTDGILTITLSAGAHTITKADSAYLFYIVLTPKSETTTEAATQATTEATTGTTTEPATEATTEATTAATTEATTEPETKDAESGSDSTGSQTSKTVIYHNFTTAGLTSDTFAISGTLSTSHGTVEYAEMELNQCLKMESKTSISFTTTGKSTLKLVFETEDSKNIKIDGTKLAFTDGILEVELEAGTHTITKADSAYLFFMELAVEQTGTSESSDSDKDEQTSEETTAQETTSDTTGAETTPSTEASTETPETDAEDPELTILPAGDIYVTPSGKASAAGTLEDPMDFVTALTKVKAGSTIWMASGTYNYTTPIIIAESNSGEEGLYKTISNIAGGKVVIDFDGMEEEGSNRGITLDGDYWHFYGIEITNAGDNGMLLSGSYNVIEMCQFYANHDTGLQLSRYNINYSQISQWPSYNKILNCTSYNNKDQKTCENADGFAAKLTCGEGNVFDGCISYCNSDDGWDLYAKPATGSIGAVTIRNCVSFGNGKLTDGTGSANGDMNGFKLGGSNGQVPTAHIVENCIAFNNGATGFTDNGNGGAISMTGCTAANNGVYAAKANFSCYRAGADATFTNLLTLASTANDETDSFKGVLSNVLYHYKDKKVSTYYVNSTTMDGNKVKYSGKEAAAYTVSASDFVTTTIPGYDAVKGTYSADYHKIFRNANGSINLNGLYELKSTSPLYTAGKDGSVLGAVIGATETFTGNTKTPVAEEETTESTTEASTESTTEAATAETTSNTGNASVGTTSTNNTQATTIQNNAQTTNNQQVIQDEPVAQAANKEEKVETPSAKEEVAETETAEIKDDTTPLADGTANGGSMSGFRYMIAALVALCLVGGIAVFLTSRKKNEQE